MKDFINFQRIKDDPLPEDADNQVFTEYEGDQAIDKKLSKLANSHNYVPIRDVDEYIKENHTSLIEHLKENKDTVAMLSLKGKKQQVRRILNDKKRISMADFREMTDKLGLRSTMELHWENIKKNYFNTENKELDKEKFFVKLLELEEAEDLRNIGSKAVGREKTLQGVKESDLDEEQIRLQENFKANVMSADGSYLTTGSHQERTMRSKEKIFGNFSRREDVINEFQEFISDEKNLKRIEEKKNIKDTKVITRKELRNFITDFVSRNNRIYAKEPDLDCVLSVLHFSDENKMHIDDIVKFFRDETTLGLLEDRKQRRQRAKPFMQKSESMALEATNYDEFDVSKALNSRVEEMGVHASTEPMLMGTTNNTRENFSKTLNMSQNGNLLQTSEEFKSISKKNGKIDRNLLNTNYMGAFEAKNFDVKKAMTTQNFKGLLEKGNLNNRGNYNTKIVNPYAPKWLEFDPNPVPNGDGKLKINDNCPIWPDEIYNKKQNEIPLSDCFNLTTNPDRPNFERYSSDRPVYMDAPKSERKEHASSKNKTKNVNKSSAELYPIRGNKNKLKWLMTKLDDALFPNSKNHKTTFDEFDKNKDGYVCEKDFVEKLQAMNIFDKGDSKLIFKAMDVEKKGFQNYAEFHEMIKPGFITGNDRQVPNDTTCNKSVAYDSIFPSVKETNNKATNSYNIKDYRKMVRDNFEQKLDIKHTRFGYIPPSYNKDTFLNYGANRTSGMFMNNADRFTRDANKHTIFQREDKSKEIDRMRYKATNLQKTSTWIEHRKDFDDLKKDMKGKAFSSKELPAFIH